MIKRSQKSIGIFIIVVLLQLLVATNGTAENKLVTSIGLNKSTLTLIAGGDTVTLTATASPSSATDKTLSWSSDKVAVATVSDKGVVTPLGEGTCTITAKANDGSGKYAQCKVTVKSKTPVVSIRLDKTTVSLTEGDGTLKLTTTITPSDATDKSVLWSSDDIGIATVDSNGYIKPISAGTCTITASAADGSGAYAECTVTVSRRTLVTDVSLDKPSLSLTAGGSAATLKATVTPTDGTNKSVTWSSSNTDVARVDNSGNVKPMNPGTCTITVKANDSSGKFAQCIVTVAANTAYSPTLTEFALSKSPVVLGDSLSFRGVLSGNGGTLEKLSISIAGPDVQTSAVQYYQATLGGAAFNLNKIPAFTVGKNYMTTVGTYWITVWGKDVYGESTLLTTTSVKVIDVPLPTLDGFTQSSESVTLGEAIMLTGTISGHGGTLSVVSIEITNSAGFSFCPYRNTNVNAETFDLSKITTALCSNATVNGIKTGDLAYVSVRIPGSSAYARNKCDFKKTGTYTIRVWAQVKGNAAATLLKTSQVTLRAPSAGSPIITLLPSRNSVTLGSTLTLRVLAKSPDGGSLSYQWYKTDGADATKSSAIVGATTATYSVPTEAKGSAAYYCVVTNTNTFALVTQASAQTPTASVTVR